LGASAGGSGSAEGLGVEAPEPLPPGPGLSGANEGDASLYPVGEAAFA